MNYIGMDIHKQFTVAVAKDRDGNKLAEEKFDNNKNNFKMFLKDFVPEETEIVIESTSIWEYIFEILEEMRYKVKLANPTKTRAIAEARIKTDSIDANTLCDLLRANLVAESYIPPKEIRNLRDIMRQRKSIVKGRTQIKNRIHAVLLMNGIKLPYTTLGKTAMKWIIDEINVTTIKSILVSYINLLEQYNFELEKLEERINEIAMQNNEAKLLMTIHGIASVRALEIIAEIGDIKRFESYEKLCSYAGLVPGIKQSGTKLVFGRLIKQANRNLKYVFIETSWTLIKPKEDNKFREFYLKLSKKKGKQKAICAVARKLCCVVYAMLTKNQEFMLL
ncbi:MAG: IS110 family transposase [Candidatus Pacearchaeota archaeon]|nr:IS110 family transposase [Candidatus Pacearchaeota archaeon]